ncbi:MAG: WXG100 family type VII secretion target [Eubacteriales bacterium]|nr:WXG100 family type VII secretion target [Eubacteriales bacterium]
MAKEFEVDVQRLGNDVEDARQNLQFLQSNLNKMFSDLQELDTMWDGDANEAFKVQVEVDREFMTDVCKNLKRILDSMDFAKAEYNRSENSVLSAVRSLRF